MSSTAPPGRQLSLDAALAAAAQDTPTVQDDRVVPTPDECSQCPRAAVKSGLCPRCWRERQNDLCGDGRSAL